ncbi:DUF2693 domain-containing protein [Apibacter sp. B3706]|uniref:SH3 beta-barrel fold-containing protein n=1 Tax=unclassified Apibacter TaxID=2630820 RepID=UPI000CF9353F|nr:MULTISPECIES: SH3 beta-barrel fold-containing protein [unclassified Apibacter]PQL89778.1 DUF2693 domain-containing protein [Apibacter sp. wkB309]QII69995.1 DUF2693 domain-containing protein [Apibacter sp. B3706]
MKTILSKIMKTAWQFFKTTGITFSECLKKAWRNYKLIKEMKEGIVRFYFQKVNGEIREAWGTLNEKYLPQTTGTDNRKKNDFLQVYFDTEKQEFRSFKKLNLI